MVSLLQLLLSILLQKQIWHTFPGYLVGIDSLRYGLDLQIIVVLLPTRGNMFYLLSKTSRQAPEFQRNLLFKGYVEFFWERGSKADGVL